MQQFRTFGDHPNHLPIGLRVLTTDSSYKPPGRKHVPEMAERGISRCQHLNPLFDLGECVFGLLYQQRHVTLCALDYANRK